VILIIAEEVQKVEEEMNQVETIISTLEIKEGQARVLSLLSVGAKLAIMITREGISIDPLQKTMMIEDTEM
jgi:hypothetical protein